MTRDALIITAAWLAFFGPYGLAGLGIVAWQARIARAARAGRVAPALNWFRSATLAYFFLPLAPAVYVAFVSFDTHGGRGTNNAAFLAAVLAIVAPQVLLGLATLWSAQRADRLTPRATTRREFLLSLFQAAGGLAGIAFASVVILAVGTKPDFLRGAAAALPLLALLLLSVRVRRSPVPAQSVSVVEMESTPLCDEILALGRHFGFRARAVKVRTVKPKDGAAPPSETRLAMAMGNWSLVCQPGDPVIPLTVFQQTDPDALTAALAVSYARRFSHNLLVRGLRRAGKRRVVRAGFLFLTIVSLTYLVRMAVAQQAEARFWLSLGAMLAVLYLAAMIARHGKRYETAFDAWRTAEPCLERTAEDFIAALARHDLAVTRVSEPHALLNLVRQNRALQRFAAKHGPSALDAALQRVETATASPERAGS